MAAVGVDSDNLVSDDDDDDDFEEEEEGEDEEVDEEAGEEVGEDDDTFLLALDRDFELLEDQFLPVTDMAELEEADYILLPPSHYYSRGPNADPILRGRRNPRRARRSRAQEEEGDDGSEVLILDSPPAAPPAVSSAAAAEVLETCGGDGNEEDVGCSVRSSGTEVDTSSAPTCSICMERWTRDGAHRVCCIPCGHLYGRSCLEKWVERCARSFIKCPQCNRKFRVKQIINLYAPLVAIANEDLEKEVTSLKEKNESLKVEKTLLLEELDKHKSRILELENSERERHKKACLNHLPGVAPTTANTFCNVRQKSLLQNIAGPNFFPRNHIKGGSLQCSFILKVELGVDEARVLDADALNQILVISRAASELGRVHILTKVSMLAPHEMEDIFLPSNIGAIKDIHIAPHSTILPGRLSLLASLGKKLSIFSMESNNIVLKYDLPTPAWSCSWNFNDLNLIYAGLQNGMISVFDIRQTAKPLRSNMGLTGYPVHSIHSILNNCISNSRTLLTASAAGPCLWDCNSTGEIPFLIPELGNRDVCISLASDRMGDNMVATFRPKVEVSCECTSPQSRSSVFTETCKVGSHTLLRRSANNCYRNYQSAAGSVSELRMPKSAIIPMEGGDLFAYGDEAFRGVWLWDLPSLQVVRRLKPHQHPILDIKYSRSTGPGLLTCISKSKLQAYACSEF